MTLVDGLLMILVLMAWVVGAAWEASTERTFLKSWILWSALFTGAAILFVCRAGMSSASVVAMVVLVPFATFLKMLQHGGWRDLFGGDQAGEDR